MNEPEPVTEKNADEGAKMRTILKWLRRLLCIAYPPNKQTLEAIESVEKGEELVECKNIDELYRKLGL